MLPTVTKVRLIGKASSAYTAPSRTPRTTSSARYPTAAASGPGLQAAAVDLRDDQHVLAPAVMDLLAEAAFAARIGWEIADRLQGVAHRGTAQVTLHRLDRRHDRHLAVSVLLIEHADPALPVLGDVGEDLVDVCLVARCHTEDPGIEAVLLVGDRSRARRSEQWDAQPFRDWSGREDAAAGAGTDDRDDAIARDLRHTSHGLAGIGLVIVQDELDLATVHAARPVDLLDDRLDRVTFGQPEHGGGTAETQHRADFDRCLRLRVRRRRGEQARRHCHRSNLQHLVSLP